MSRESLSDVWWYIFSPGNTVVEATSYIDSEGAFDTKAAWNDGFNILKVTDSTWEEFRADEFDSKNALWLNSAVLRGDEIWEMDDPSIFNNAHRWKSDYFRELDQLNEYYSPNTIIRYEPALY